MANITEVKAWRPVYQLEITDWGYGGAPSVDPVTGAPTAVGQQPGILNVPTKNLVDRTAYLKFISDIRKGAFKYQNVVLSCKLDANGEPDYMGITPGSPNNLISFDVDSTNPLALKFNNGFDEHGPVEYFALIESILDLAVPENAAYAIVATLNPNTLAVTFSYESADPSVPLHVGYFEHGTVVNNQWWYDLSEMKMKQRVAGVWVDKIAVLLGIAITIPLSEEISYFPVSVDYGATIGNDVHEPGSVILSAKTTPTRGWLLCDGAAVSRQTYKRLFAAIGTSYGTGNGTTTFNLPNINSLAANPNTNPDLNYIIKI